MKPLTHKVIFIRLAFNLNVQVPNSTNKQLDLTDFVLKRSTLHSTPMKPVKNQFLLLLPIGAARPQAHLEKEKENRLVSFHYLIDNQYLKVRWIFAFDASFIFTCSAAFAVFVSFRHTHKNDVRLLNSISHRSKDITTWRRKEVVKARIYFDSKSYNLKRM